MLGGLRGPVLEAAQGKAEMLVVLCHGYGANGDDLLGLGRAWRSLLPSAAFASPHGPEPCPGAPGGRQWFGLDVRDPAIIAEGVRRGAVSLQAYLDKELARLGLSGDRLALVGFSQGTMMALHVAFARSRAPMAVVGYAGALATPIGAGADGLRPPTLLVHGEIDDRVPPQAMFAASTALADAGVPTLWSMRPRLGHAIDEIGVALGGRWLADAQAGRLAGCLAPCAS